MFTRSFIYILSGVVISSILCIDQGNGNTNESSNHCAKYNHICNPHSLQPCCGSTLSCKLKKSRNDFVCAEKTELGISCFSDEDCSDITHAKCSTEKKCICRENNLRLNKTYCAPSLKGFCWKNETCVTNNAMCIDNECKCRENYSEWEDQCLPVPVGLRCRSDKDCSEIAFGRCWNNNRCVYPTNTVAIKNTSYTPFLYGYCATDNDCKLNNSICVNNVCNCRSEYAAIIGSRCTQPYLGMPCVNDIFCNFYINHTICSPKNECICSSSSYHYDRSVHSLLFNMSTHYEDCRAKLHFCFDNKCYHYFAANFSEKFCIEDDECYGSLLGEFCDIDRDCQVYNSVCSDKKCICKMNYRNSSMFSCLPSMLGQNCRSDSYCSTVPNAECSHYDCKCRAGYLKSNATACLPLLGNLCTTSDECIVKYSICYNGHCECDDFYAPQSNDRCLGMILHKTCEKDLDCNSIKYSYCSHRNVCSCKKNTIAMHGSACAAFLGQRCSFDLPCVTENSWCIENECQCRPFFTNSNNQCLPTRLGESCNEDDNCKMIKYAKCSANEICACDDNYISVSDKLCVALLNAGCQIDDNCYVNNSVCIDSICRCKDNFLAADSNSRCEFIVLGKKCFKSKDCSIILNSICSSDGICICRPSYFAVGNHFCTPTVNSNCSTDEECLSDSFRCVDRKCQCEPGYTPIAVDRCTETHSLYFCEDTSQCSDSWHWNCSTSGKCVCNVNNIAINNLTCLPTLNGYCWRDDQCMAENSACIDFRCQCKPYFVAAADNHCVFKME